jgi:hypothetical protein
MLQFQEIKKTVKVKGKKKYKERTRYRIFINRGYGSSMGNMLEVLSGEAVKQEPNWIEVEKRHGSFIITDENMTDKKGNWVVDNTSLGFSGWDDEVKDLDNGYSDESQCFGMSTKLQWNEVVLTLESFSAPSIERLCEALEHVGICAWCPGDI